MSAIVKENYYLDKQGNPTYPKNMARNKFNMSVNKRLREARNKRGYSLAKAVASLKVRGEVTSVSTIQGYEAEENNINHRYPSLHKLLQLVNLYNCSMDYVFGLTEEMERPSQDLLQNIQNLDKIYWNGKEMSQGQKIMAVEMLNKIMSIEAKH